MTSLVRTSRSLRPLFRHAAPARSMTIISKESGEEFKKEVRGNDCASMPLDFFTCVHLRVLVYEFDSSGLNSSVSH
jgi:hypothetical protein